MSNEHRLFLVFAGQLRSPADEGCSEDRDCIGPPRWFTYSIFRLYRIFRSCGPQKLAPVQDQQLRSAPVTTLQPFSPPSLHQSYRHLTLLRWTRKSLTLRQNGIICGPQQKGAKVAPF